MGRRTLLLIAALVVAALGTALIFVYVNTVKDDAIADATPVQVLVATQQVEVGTTASDASNAGAFEIQEVPSSAAADGSLTDISIIADEVALAPIFPGQQVLAQMFGVQGTTSGLSVPNGKVAISVQLGDPERVAGFVSPGSDVTIFATCSDSGNCPGGQTWALLPKVNVIGVGASTLTTQTTTDQTGESTTSDVPLTILTLSVDQLQAEMVIQAQSEAALYFGLLGDGTKIKTPFIITHPDLFR